MEQEITKSIMLEYIALEQSGMIKESGQRNRMGCLESWYDPLYAIAHTFTGSEIENMSEEELGYLNRLACTLSEALR